MPNSPTPCRHLAPCGEPCCLTTIYPHTIHGCSEAKCTDCHGTQRFIDNTVARRRAWREQAQAQQRTAMQAEMEGLE